MLSSALYKLVAFLTFVNITMATPASKDLRIDAEDGDLKIYGLFRHGVKKHGKSKPLIVLIHGTGDNALYFDNKFFSVPANFSALGHDVLNINRPGYSGNPIPKTSTPLMDTLPLYAKLIKKVFQEHSKDSGGVVLIGHSLGGATVLALGAYYEHKLPILGISALGAVPMKEIPSNLEFLITENPESPLFVVPPTAEMTATFMGPPGLVDDAILLDPSMIDIFVPGLKSELTEWWSPIWYNRFFKEVAPAINVPLQYLAAEFEINWSGFAEGQPIFDRVVKSFTNVKRLDAVILPGGGHNYEFSKNRAILQHRREAFINNLDCK